MHGHRILGLNILALAIALLVGGQFSLAQQVPDAIGDHLFPPDLIKMAHEQIGLTEDQVASIRGEVQKAQERIADLKQRLLDEMHAMAKLVEKERPDEKAVFAQSETVVKLEGEIKQAELAMLVRIKNALTPEQQAKLKDIKARAGAVKAKMEKVKAAVQRWEKEGRDLSSLRDLKAELDPLLNEKKFEEAEAVLDRALRLLEDKEQK
ncbi:MAG: hypothetical protein NTU53_02545 [Planctomycetota bacterium]|nr:hypothetical protein [Planctomycetota bacterium]